MGKNMALNRAKELKDDEWYTQYTDIEKEIQFYRPFLDGKIIHCPCDAPWSNFYKVLRDNFHDLKLKAVFATGYNINSAKGSCMFYDGNKEEELGLEYDGSFQSPEILQIMETADVIITNPPFSLMASFLRTLTKMEKDFLIVCPLTAFESLPVRHLIKTREVIMGVTNRNMKMEFGRPDGATKTAPATWMTTMEHGQIPPPLELTETYDPVKYPKYDNHDVISVDKIKEIPNDYDGIMGVPAGAFLAKWNTDQFQVLGHDREFNVTVLKERNDRPWLDGNRKFNRLFIRRRRIK